MWVVLVVMLSVFFCGGLDGGKGYYLEIVSLRREREFWGCGL